MCFFFCATLNKRTHCVLYRFLFVGNGLVGSTQDFFCQYFKCDEVECPVRTPTSVYFLVTIISKIHSLNDVCGLYIHHLMNESQI